MSRACKLLNLLVTKNATQTFIKSHRALSTGNPHILTSDLKDVEIPNISIPEYIVPKLAKYEKLTAVECGVTGRKYTYGDILSNTINFNKALRKHLKLNKGDVVAFLLPNIPEYPIALIGTMKAGLVVTTLNPLYTPEEISRQLQDSSAKALVTLTLFWETATKSCNILKKKIPVITIKTKQSQSTPQGAIDFNEFANNVIDFPDVEPSHCQDIAFLPYSSGTTGLPKGVELSHNNVVANVCQNAAPDFPFIKETTATYQDVIPVILPMFHIYGFTVNTLFTLSKGTKLITLPKFTPEDYISVLQNHKPNILFVVPPIVLFLSGSSSVKSSDLQSVRTVFSGAAPLGGLDEEKFLKKAEKHIHMLQGYGLTETSPTITALTIDVKNQTNVSGSIGRPTPNTFIKIIAVDDLQGIPLGPNCQGELLVKGPQVTRGYLNRPEETKAAFLDGWFRTGDLVYYNEDRLLFVNDRLKELIKVKGFQVAPAELEEIIRSFPNVSDAAVIGITDPKQGEAPRAYVVPKKDAKINITDLNNYVKSKVAEYKQLKGGIAIVDSIPKNASGKILRRTLKLEFEKSSA